MGYKCSFLDNEVYGADDVSAAFSRIVRGGVLAYPETETVASALNELNSEVISSGVSEFGGLEVIRTETGALVGQGTGFFESGVSVFVDSEGATVNFEEESAVYIYFIYQPEFNTVLLKATTEIPQGDVLLLAYVDSEGVVFDHRSYAISKVAINTSNTYHDFSISHEQFCTAIEKATYRSQTVYKMPHNGFRYLLLREGNISPLAYAPKEHIIDLSVGGIQEFILNDSSIVSRICVEKQGTNLIITSVSKSSYDPHTIYFTLA